MLSDRGKIVIEGLPPYLADASDVKTIVGTAVDECENIEETAWAVRESMVPQTATDVYGFLSAWERMLGLPVAPPDIPIVRRQDNVIANIRGRNAGSGLNWERRITEVLGSGNWRYREFDVAHGDQPYTIYIFIPFSSTGYRAGQVQQLARRVTPAHLDLVVSYDSAFIVGESTVDDTSQIGIDVL